MNVYEMIEKKDRLQVTLDTIKDYRRRISLVPESYPEWVSLMREDCRALEAAIKEQALWLLVRSGTDKTLIALDPSVRGEVRYGSSHLIVQPNATGSAVRIFSPSLELDVDVLVNGPLVNGGILHLELFSDWEEARSQRDRRVPSNWRRVKPS